MQDILASLLFSGRQWKTVVSSFYSLWYKPVNFCLFRDGKKRETNARIKGVLIWAGDSFTDKVFSVSSHNSEEEEEGSSTVKI